MITGPNEATIAVAIRALFADYLAAIGYPHAVTVLQMQQPTQQGQPAGNLLYFQRLPERVVGSPERRDVWDALAGDFAHVQSTQFEVTYQFNAMTDPIDPTVEPPLPTPSDLLRLASFAVQSDRGLRILREAGIGVLRVEQLRNVYVLDDRDQNESEPSFDAVFTYRNEVTDRVPVVERAELEVHRV